MHHTFRLILACALAAGLQASAEAPRVAGYQGIWFTLGQKGEYGDKYSGGLGTYTAKHKPIAVYAPEAKKTFFTYGGAKDGKRHLLIMASYYDHERGVVPQPVVVLDKQGVNDPHDNASIALDDTGHVWIFVSGRGRSRPGFKFRSVEPYSIDAFEQISEEEMTYPQPWWIPGRGFIHMFTKYTAGRELYFETSPDGVTWSEDHKFAAMGGHYQNSRVKDGVVFTAFNMHPGGSVDKRTNLYFLQSRDFGESWQTIDGETVDLPLTDPNGPGLVRDYRAEGRLVYMKDIEFDEAGNPVILIVTSGHHMPGPEAEPRRFELVRWDGAQWVYSAAAPAHHNYDMGSLYLERPDLWRIIAPTEIGPQRWGAGGEMALWESINHGADWTKVRDITNDSPLNHTYARKPLNAQDDFYALWADGHTETESPSHLYFTNHDGTAVWQLPYTMDAAFAVPERVLSAPASKE
ncbi:MAG: hypothetical protein GC168_06385 [Candidatus Hydrogenedens sp.]|nr:hypothetical protein [Candidatus Hydrogenedens sp.]